MRQDRLALEAGDPQFAGAGLDYHAVRALAEERRSAIVYLQPLAGEADGLLALVIHPGSPLAAPAGPDLLRLPGLHRAAVTELLMAQRPALAKGRAL